MKKTVLVVMLVFMLEILVGCSAVITADRLAANEAAGHNMTTVSCTYGGK